MAMSPQLRHQTSHGQLAGKPVVDFSRARLDIEFPWDHPSKNLDCGPTEVSLGIQVRTQIRISNAVGVRG